MQKNSNRIKRENMYICISCVIQEINIFFLEKKGIQNILKDEKRMTEKKREKFSCKRTKKRFAIVRVRENF